MYLPNIVWKCHSYVQPKLNAELFAIKRTLIEPLPLHVIHDDAYIHAELVRRGYSVLYVQNAIVFNCAPTTLQEFYAQRKKNVLGNLQLTQYFKSNIPSGMRLRSLMLMSIELIANIHGRLDYVRGNIPVGLIGYNLKTTKEVKINKEINAINTNGEVQHV